MSGSAARRALAGTSHAAVLFSATPTNAQACRLRERAPESCGTASFELNDAQTALSFSAEIYSIDLTGTQTPGSDDDLVSAHIHRDPRAPSGGVGLFRCAVQ
jgi:hypothetical protein